MITIQEIEIALENADYELSWNGAMQPVRWTSKAGLYFNAKPTKRGLLKEILTFCQCHECYFFNKRHVEYGTIDYGINELIEDLQLWL